MEEKRIGESLRRAQAEIKRVARIAENSLPVRFIAYALGVEVNWTPAAQGRSSVITLTADGRTLDFRVGEITPALAALGMDVPAQTRSNRTMVPLRFISEFFGAAVTWDNATRTAEIIFIPAKVSAAKQENRCTANAPAPAIKHEEE